MTGSSLQERNHRVKVCYSSGAGCTCSISFNLVQLYKVIIKRRQRAVIEYLHQLTASCSRNCGVAHLHWDSYLSSYQIYFIHKNSDHHKNGHEKCWWHWHSCIVWFKMPYINNSLKTIQCDKWKCASVTATLVATDCRKWSALWQAVNEVKEIAVQCNYQAQGTTQSVLYRKLRFTFTYTRKNLSDC